MAGGDRDGNPFVTTEITLKVANKLREAIMKNYYRDVKKIRRRLTFENVYEPLSEIENKLYKNFTQINEKPAIALEELKSELLKIREVLINSHNSLFINLLDSLLNKIQIFGYHFATLDIRQDSRVHQKRIHKHCPRINR